MDERPEQPPEGRLIATALKRARLSGRKAADRAGMSEGHWRAIVSGSRSIASGVWVPVRGPAETLARMAEVVGVTPEQLEQVDRGDAAEALRVLSAAESTEAEEQPTVAELAAQLRELQARFDALQARVDEDREAG